MRSLRGVLRQIVHYHVKPVAVLDAYGYHLVEFSYRGVLRKLFEQLALVLHKVYLIEQQHDVSAVFERRSKLPFRVGNRLGAVAHEKSRLALVNAVLHRLHHMLAELVLCLVLARRVHEDILRFVLGQHARYARARSLRLCRYRRNLLAHKSVQQRGFPHVRSADYRYKYILCVHILFITPLLCE